MNNISFPQLGISLDINRIAVSFGPFSIYWYGIIVVSGIGLGMLYAMKRSKEFGLHPDRVLDVTLYSIIAGLIGARIYYVAFTWEYYSLHPQEILSIWMGGIAIYGGIIGAFLMGAFLCRRWKIPLLPMADVAVGGLILGQAIGRWGNFVNSEAFGGNTTLPWGMTGTQIVAYLQSQMATLQAAGMTIDPAMPVHPTFLYESVWNFAGFLFLLWYTSRRRFNGELALIYIAWYGLARSWIEGLRTDSLMWGNIRVSQMVAIAGALVAALLWVSLMKKARAGELGGIFVVPDREARLAQAEAMAPIVKKKGQSTAESLAVAPAESPTETPSAQTEEEENPKTTENYDADANNDGESL